MLDRVFGATETLQAAGARAQLVRVSGLPVPQVWTLDLQAEGAAPVRFQIVAGAGQASRAFDLVVLDGRLPFTVSGTDLQVSVVHEGPSGTLNPVRVSAFAALGSPLDHSPTLERSGVFGLPVDIPASGRLRAIIYNPSAADAVEYTLSDIGGVVVGRVGPRATATVEWPGGIGIRPTGAAAVVNVAELFK